MSTTFRKYFLMFEIRREMRFSAIFTGSINALIGVKQLQSSRNSSAVVLKFWSETINNFCLLLQWPDINLFLC